MNAILSYKKKLPQIIWSTLIIFFSFLMFQITKPYSSWEWDIDFLQTKSFIIHLNYYRYSFYAHIFSSLIVLFSGAFLFSNYILKNWSVIHRCFGKLYVVLVLFISAPSGLVMAFHANGGWVAKSSFLILTPLWWWFTYKGYQTVRQKNFKAHRVWMMRSYALTLSAISLRLLQFIFGQFFYMEADEQYILVSWTSWVFNLLIVEALIGITSTKLKWESKFPFDRNKQSASQQT